MLMMIFHTDPGHGWLQVPGAVLREVISEDRVSGFSYYDKETDTFFLEEDCDAALVTRPLRDAGYELRIEESYEDETFVRKLPRWEGRLADKEGQQ